MKYLFFYKKRLRVISALSAFLSLFCLQLSPGIAAEPDSTSTIQPPEQVLATSGSLRVLESARRGEDTRRQAAARALLSFLDQQILPRAPRRARAALAERGLELAFIPAATIDGLFLALEAGPLRIELREDLLGSPALRPLVAHEAFHALHFLLHPDEEPWVREGLAQNFERLVTGRHNGVHVQAAFVRPSVPLMSEYDPERAEPAAYGHSLLYFHYLLERCGGEAMLWEITEGFPGRFGERGIDAALAANAASHGPECATFAASARAFQIARAHNRVDPRTGSRTNFLLATSFRARAGRDAPPIERLRALPRLTPVLLEGRAASSTSVPPGLTRIWLETRFPYRVIEGAAPTGSAPGAWRLLIFRE
jgi:hypothetical protein